MAETIASGTDLPPNFSESTDPKTGKKYYLDHATRTTSFRHPRHTVNHEPYTPDLPYPFERQFDSRGRAWYLNHEKKSTSWLNPVKLAELERKGVVEKSVDEFGEDEEAWRQWVLSDMATAPNEGDEYWVDYRSGTVDWRSPEDKRVAREMKAAKIAMAAAEIKKTDENA